MSIGTFECHNQPNIAGEIKTFITIQITKADDNECPTMKFSGIPTNPNDSIRNLEVEVPS